MIKCWNCDMERAMGEECPRCFCSEAENPFVATPFPETACCATCHFYSPEHETCGCGDSVNRAEFVHPAGRCPQWLEATIDTAPPL